MSPNEYEAAYNKLFMAYEECRSDNTAHFRKILELQQQNKEFQDKLNKCVEALKYYSVQGEWTKAALTLKEIGES